MTSHPTIPTAGGRVTRSETFTKVLYHIDELRSLCAVMAHLHQTEDGGRDRLLAKGWLGIEQLLKMMRGQIVELAQGKLLS